jgi:hypothetical protein
MRTKAPGPRTEEQESRPRAATLSGHWHTGNAADYWAFESIITADYDVQSAVERELVLRLASLLWRLRRAATVKTGLFEIQAERDRTGLRQDPGPPGWLQ